MKNTKSINKYIYILFILFIKLSQPSIFNKTSELIKKLHEKSFEYKKTSISLLLCLSGIIIYKHRKLIKENLIPLTALLGTHTGLCYLLFRKDKKI